MRSQGFVSMAIGQRSRIGFMLSRALIWPRRKSMSNRLAIPGEIGRETGVIPQRCGLRVQRRRWACRGPGRAHDSGRGGRRVGQLLRTGFGSTRGLLVVCIGPRGDPASAADFTWKADGPGLTGVPDETRTREARAGQALGGGCSGPRPCDRKSRRCLPVTCQPRRLCHPAHRFREFRRWSMCQRMKLCSCWWRRLQGIRRFR